MPKILISRKQNLDNLAKLQNGIVNLEGLSKLKSLKILNAGNNLITKLEELNSQTEFNIKNELKREYRSLIRYNNIYNKTK